MVLSIASALKRVQLPYFDSIERSAALNSKKRKLSERTTRELSPWEQDRVDIMRQHQISEEQKPYWARRTPGKLPERTDLYKMAVAHKLRQEYEMSFGRSIIIHKPRTLDESYYTGLEWEELSERNKSQVVSQKRRQSTRNSGSSWFLSYGYGALTIFA